MGPFDLPFNGEVENERIISEQRKSTKITKGYNLSSILNGRLGSVKYLIFLNDCSIFTPFVYIWS